MSKTILIVGANRGLGLQFALQYQAKGFNVYGTYRKESVDEAKEVRNPRMAQLINLIYSTQLLDSGVKTITLDLADETSIKDASKSFGDQPLDFLINCAGKFQHSSDSTAIAN